MLLKKQEKDNTIEALFDSSNLYKTIYLKDKNIMYIFFKKGGVYSYYNIDNELYQIFESADSQGEFFTRTIKHHKDIYPCSKEFTMKKFEINDLTEQIKEALNESRGDNRSTEEMS